jgi:uncharacterized repeat protein (TIGR03803 family)
MQKPSQKSSRAGVILAALFVLTCLLTIWPTICAAQPATKQGFKYKVLHKFKLGLDASGVAAGVILDAEGNLYGTTSGGGNYAAGDVYKLSPARKQTVLYSFTGEADGFYPLGLIFDVVGNLYGTTYGGGADSYGTIFKLDTTGKETVLYSFTGTSDGAYPQSPLIQDAQGNFYGTTSVACLLWNLDCFFGGYSGGARGGTVFELSKSGVFKVLYTFTGGADGDSPWGVIRDANGNFYGATSYGGAHGFGTVFKLTSSGDETVLYNFTGGSDGGNPFAPLIEDAGGNFYGTTFTGGITTGACHFLDQTSCGTVFKLSSSGAESVLYAFTGESDGALPSASLIEDSAGNLYGTTVFGGKYGGGTVFKVGATGGETVLYNFRALGDGAMPVAGLTSDADGNLYGTTWSGGIVYECGGGNAGGCGVAFKMTPK